MSRIAVILIFLFVVNVSAQTLTLQNANITGVQTYATPDDSVSVWLHVNGDGRVGPNPNNPSKTCELWTHDKTVYSTALAAAMSGKKVTITYKDRGEGTYWCDTVNLVVHSN
ncbi:hypothetical protein [Rheinheimera pacifica]|uniref:hypothetical protein n=1 Tax=Rheinheimera pacifica TaxID=173990 RepID=UPI002ED9655A